MKIKHLIQATAEKLTKKYGSRLLPGHRKALDAMLACRSQCGEFLTHCDQCHIDKIIPLSCGHRSCPQCQHHLCDIWLQRQQQKLLPVNYFVVTFTLPTEIRSIAWKHQSIMYDILFKASVEALQTVGRNNHLLNLGVTAVLHTHKRDKSYFPHLHIVVPGGGIKIGDKQTWQRFKGGYFINEFALAQIFRGILLRMMFEQEISLPSGLPKQWVCNIKKVGCGEKALQYLSRYLYRGVISENDILADHEGKVTFRYKDSETNKMVTKKQNSEDFLWNLLRHVLPRGFRRVRDYGFLHSNAKKMLKAIQGKLKVKLPRLEKIKKEMPCPECQAPMTIEIVRVKKIPMQFRFYDLKEFKKIPSLVPL